MSYGADDSVVKFPPLPGATNTKKSLTKTVSDSKLLQTTSRAIGSRLTQPLEVYGKDTQIACGKRNPEKVLNWPREGFPY